MIEAYKNIPDTEFVPLIEGIDPVFLGKYEINKRGEIRHIKNGLKKQIKNGNYFTVCLNTSSYSKNYRINVLVAKTFLENDSPEAKKIVDHIDRNSFNNHVDNLRWVTYRENRLNSKDNAKTTMMYRIIDENGKLLRNESSLNYTKDERHKIAKAIYRHSKYKNCYWERYDYEVATLLEKLNLEEDDIDFITSSRDKNILCSKEGIFKILSKSTITLGTKRANGYRKINCFSADRLIFETFSGHILKDSEYIDHINTDPSDNRYVNLRLCTSVSENMKNSNTQQKLCKEINQYDLNGVFIQSFPSAKQAGIILGINNTHITSCCRGKRKTCGGFKWKYKF